MKRTLPLILLALAAGCGGSGESGPAASRSTVGDGRTFTNPVHASNFPDPFVLRSGDTYHAYATNDEDGNVQTLRSTDLVTWEQGPDALPELGSWAYAGKTWAPEVLALAGSYVLYYTANAAEYGRQCIGRAVADTPEGPFVDRWDEPLVCQQDEGGSIDASPFRDEDGTPYLLWKNDGNCCALDTWIYAQRLSADGVELEGEPARLVKQDAGWEASVVEAPTLWRQDGRYYLFFSANAFDSDLYAVGYATCEAPLGPCEDAAGNPILKSACDASGPGHQAVVVDDDGETWLAYHAWPAAGGDERVLWLDRLDWKDGAPVVSGPTCEAQPAP
ncbi:MAG TPA: glycoside hydrolase family 43 protein [Gaiellaceae bacterium]|nr:glycoside hydrolase family 43 protein [Gaiellaceae bacterium]